MTKALEKIQITAILPSGSAFALTTESVVQDAVFIPGTVAKRLVLTEGQVLNAVLVPNTRNENSAQWLASRVEAVSHSIPKGLVMQAVSVARIALHRGGIWTADSVFAQCHECVESFPQNAGGQQAIAQALEHIYERGEAVRVALQHSGAEDEMYWYTRTPDAVVKLMGATQ